MSYDDIKDELMQNHHQTEFAAAEIAYLSNGNLTEALAMLQQENKSYHTLFVQWLRLCFGNKGPGSNGLCGPGLQRWAAKIKRIFCGTASVLSASAAC